MRENKNSSAVKVWFTNDRMYILLTDGREIGVPLEWFPSLRNASPVQRENWRFIGKGSGIHWNDLDEDISIEGLL